MSFLPFLPFIGSAISGIMFSETVRYLYTQDDNEPITNTKIENKKPFNNSLLCDIQSFDKKSLNSLIQKKSYPKEVTLLDELKIKLKENRKSLEY